MPRRSPCPESAVAIAQQDRYTSIGGGRGHRHVEFSVSVEVRHGYGIWARAGQVQLRTVEAHRSRQAQGRRKNTAAHHNLRHPTLKRLIRILPSMPRASQRPRLPAIYALRCSGARVLHHATVPAAQVRFGAFLGRGLSPGIECYRCRFRHRRPCIKPDSDLFCGSTRPPGPWRHFSGVTTLRATHARI